MLHSNPNSVRIGRCAEMRGDLIDVEPQWHRQALGIIAHYEFAKEGSLAFPSLSSQTVSSGRGPTPSLTVPPWRMPQFSVFGRAEGPTHSDHSCFQSDPSAGTLVALDGITTQSPTPSPLPLALTDQMGWPQLPVEVDQPLVHSRKRRRIQHNASCRVDEQEGMLLQSGDSEKTSINENVVSEEGEAEVEASREDFRSMAAIVVNHCIQQGRLPLFGSDAIHLILRVVEQAICDPHVISSLGVYAHADDVTRWQAVLQHADLSRLEIETEQSGAAMASNYLNRKISERWSCKAKSLLKLIRPITSTPLRGSAIRDDRVLRAIGKWAGVSVGEVTLRQCVLGIWRVNKMLEGVSLKSDIQRARERVKGHSRSHTEFELARGMWEAELRSLESEIFTQEYVQRPAHREYSPLQCYSVILSAFLL